MTGNLIVNVCRKYVKREGLSIPELQDLNLKKHLLLTLHRPETVDRPDLLKQLMNILSAVEYDIIFPVHPTTKDKLFKYKIPIPSNVHTILPVGYIEFLGLLRRSTLALTDSGGVQEESVILGKPCITLRPNTERQETLLIKANRLYPIGDGTGSLADAIDQMMDVKITLNPYGENVTNRTFSTLNNIINNIERYELTPPLPRSV